ncbi:MAG: PH domain-containing protein [Planctomycetes bacterium]|nr:PH domain-containing protein [Planctomycetota bacterium]
MTDGSDPPPLPSDPRADAAVDELADDAVTAPAPATATPAADATVLARGHLHPAILLLRLLDAGRQVVFPLLIGIAVEPWFLVAALVLFVLQLGYSVVRYLTLEYTLTDEELRIREGLLHRQERRIPLDRIQDLGFESTILRRALGLSVVMVETASGRGVEARLDALARGDAEHLREVLMAARPASARKRPSGDADAAGEATADAPDPSIAEPDPATPQLEWLVHRSTTGELLIRGATDMRLGAFAVTGYAAFELADQLGFVTQLAGIASSFRGWLGTLPPALVFGVLAALLFAVMAFGVITSTLGNLVQFHGFNLVLRGDVLQRRYGLLTTRQKTLPRARVQRVTVEQTWLRRLCGFAVVKADSAGGSRSDGQDATGGWDVVVPLTRADTAHALLPALLPGIERTSFGWRRGSRKLIARTALQGVLLAAALLGGLWWKVGANALWALALVPLWSVLGVLIWRNLGWARGDDFFALQHGVIGRTFACVPTAKIQAVVVRQGVVSQLLRLADLTVYVAGGSPTRIPDLTLRDARELCRELADRAAVAAAADW